MKNLLRALKFFGPDRWGIAMVVVLLLVSIALNVLKPWPLALLVDNVLGQKPYPSWVPENLRNLGQPSQLAAIIGALLALHLGHATISAVQLYLSISIGLRGLRRVRNEVFGWLQRLSLRFHHGTQAGDIIFRAGTDTYAFQTLFQQGLLIFITAFFTLLFMIVVMIRLNLQLTLLALVAVPVLLASIKVFGRAMRRRGMEAQKAESKVYSLIHQGIRMAATLIIRRQRKRRVRRAGIIGVTQSGLHSVGARQPTQKMIEGTIFHHDHHDVVGHLDDTAHKDAASEYFISYGTCPSVRRW